MLMRARQAALAAQTVHRVPTAGLPSVTAVAPSGLPAHSQALSTASLHIAAALAAQASSGPSAMRQVPAAAAAVTAGRPPLLQQLPAVAMPVPALPTAAAVSAGPPQNAAVPAQQPRPQANASNTGLAPTAPPHSISTAVVPTQGRSAGALAPLMPVLLYAVPPPTADTTAVAGGGHGLRVVHKPSLDVLRLRLRLVDMVQGSTALQPKVCQ